MFLHLIWLLPWVYSAQASNQGTAVYFARTAIVLTPTFFATPVEWSLHSDGRVYFEAIKQSTSENGLYISGGGGGFQAIMESGDPAPELNALTMYGPSLWVGHDNGYAFQVRLEGPGVTTTNDRALYAGTLASGPRLIFREGDEVDEIPGAFYSFGASELKVNYQGDVLFVVDLISGPASSALMVDDGASKHVIGTASPTGLLNPVISPSGRIALIGFLDGAFKIWSGSPSNPQASLAVGGTVPGTQGTIAEFDDLSFANGSSLSFAAALTNGNDAIFSGLPNGTQLVTESSHLLSRLSPDSIGRLAYEESVPSGDEINLKQANNAATLIAKVGNQAPDLVAGVTFFQFNGHASNKFRQVAFWAQLSGTGIGPANDRSLWIYDPFFGTQIMAKEGSTIEINPADTRTLEQIIPVFPAYSLQDGGQKSFNARGELAYVANFTDGQTAILVGRLQSPDPVYESGFD